MTHLLELASSIGEVKQNELPNSNINEFHDEKSEAVSSK